MRVDLRASLDIEHRGRRLRTVGASNDEWSDVVAQHCGYPCLIPSTRGLQTQRLEQRLQSLAAPEDSRLDRADGHLEHGRNLLVVEALHVAQRDRHTQLVGQRRQRPVNRVAPDEVGLDVDRVRCTLDWVILTRLADSAGAG